MNLDEPPWTSIDLRAYLKPFMNVDGRTRSLHGESMEISLDVNQTPVIAMANPSILLRRPSISMYLHRSLWISMGLHAPSWTFMDLLESPFLNMDLDGPASTFTRLHGGVY